MCKIKTLYSAILDYNYNDVFTEDNTEWVNDDHGGYELTYNENTIIERIAEDIAEELEASDEEYDFILNTLTTDKEAISRLENAWEAYREASYDYIEYEEQVRRDYYNYIYS